MNATPDLTYPMKLALRTIATHQAPGQWLVVAVSPLVLDRGTVTALERRGLVDYDPYLGWVRLTGAGRSAAAELKGDGNG